MKGLSERVNGATLALRVNPNLKPIHDMNTTPLALAQCNPRIYVLLRPFPPVAPAVALAAPKACVTPTTPAPAALPPRKKIPPA